MNDGTRHIAAMLPTKLIGRADRERHEIGAATNVERPCIDAQRPRRSARYAVQRFGSRQSKELASKIGDGL
jgi:hypothetical protein